MSNYCPRDDIKQKSYQVLSRASTVCNRRMYFDPVCTLTTVRLIVVIMVNNVCNQTILTKDSMFNVTCYWVFLFHTIVFLVLMNQKRRNTLEIQATKN